MNDLTKIQQITACPTSTGIALIGLGDNSLPYMWDRNTGEWQLCASEEVLAAIKAAKEAAAPFPGIQEPLPVQEAVAEEVTSG